MTEDSSIHHLVLAHQEDQKQIGPETQSQSLYCHHEPIHAGTCYIMTLCNYAK